ncbi:response regulator transcription factor [Paenibacillus pasadenensis]|uniref:response regulator transcription factor n=1 Tax=Paenibacillus pasadenensis TaxID=217090 RepID=UPI00203E6065|nr:response regulator transcription factor [Paenibacillus pasadenensis]MCM3748577.1 response regulator transcription factor [Paenibacillus pasadenensis]
MTELILLVEDDEALGPAIEFSLTSEGYRVFRETNVKGAQQRFAQQIFDLAILDVNLPDGSGYNLCREFKAVSEVPVIFLTALDDEANVVMGLEIGGDDYVTKPFRVKELMSRVKVQLRRKKQKELPDLVLKSGHLTVEAAGGKVFKEGCKLLLTSQEYRLLLLFMKNAHRTLTRDELLSSITDADDVLFFDENTLSVYIKRLRDKIEDDVKQPEFIVTQRGRGYRWDKDVNSE